jgi:tetratricopeptide (TPR) repeat protein
MRRTATAKKRAKMKPGRNDPCPCGSGKRYKHCCGLVSAAVPHKATPSSGPLSPHELGALMTLINQGRVREAEDRALALLNIHPGTGMVWKILGIALVQQGKDAVPALRKAAEFMPQDAELHSNLGAVLLARGRWTEALACLQRALELRPDDFDVLSDAADATRALGRARDSVSLYERALERNPRAAEVRNNLGNAFLELGEPAEAAEHYRRAIEIKSNSADVYCNLGNALRQLGNFEEAIIASRQAIALNPRLAMAHNNLGLALVGLGRRQEAVPSYREALALNPNYVEALNNLGNVLPELGERREAVSLLRKAIELDPKRPESHRALASLLFEFRQYAESADSYRRTLALDPRDALGHAGLGAVLRMQGVAREAEASCQAALAIDRRCAPALSLLGELRADRGGFAEAEELFRQAIAIDPEFPFAFYGIATNRKMSRDDGMWLEGVQALLGKPLALRHEISLRYALGKYFDDTERYDDAFANYRKANELSRRYGVRYDPSAVSQRVEHVMRSFDAAAIRAYQSGADPSERPVFIIGMPRSGTSLTEQILASHPAVFGAGELAFWQLALGAHEVVQLESRAEPDLVPNMARDYLDGLKRLSRDALRVIDKMPSNFMSAGLICAALPRARIIHVRRDPIDTCLSIYFHYLSHAHPYANDLESLAHYYRQYLRITDHWRTTLPASSLLDVPYEGLIEDQEGWTRRMLDFIDLPWDPKCLDFHQTDRSVITLSKWQVRQKIHSSSAGRWRHYEKYVGPLRRLIESPDESSVTGARE